MEARNFITAREMLDDGNWLLTTMNGLPRYEKPPLPSWITAIFGIILGKNTWGLRVPTMLIAIILAWITYLFSFKLLQNKKHALINALILMTSFYIITITNEAPWDIYTHTFMLAGIYFLFHFFESHDKQWKNSLWAAFFIGLSFMSKGPVSMYVILLPFLIAYGITYTYSGFRKKILPLTLFLITTIAISLWWYIYIRLADPETFLAITKKEAGNWNSYNIRPFYYYWSFFTQSGIWTLPAFISLLYPYLKNRVSNKRAYLFSLLWTLISVFLLSVIPEKKSRYLAPVLIPLAINLGFYIEYAIRAFKTQFSKAEKIPVYFNFGLISFIGLAFPFVVYFFLKEEIHDFWVYYLLSSLVLFSIGISLIITLRKQQIEHVFFLTIAFVIAIKVCAFPLFKTLQKKEVSANITFFSKTLQSKLDPVYSYGRIEPEMIWHYGKSIPVIKNESGISIPKETSFFVLVGFNDENEFKRIFDAEYDIIHEASFDINSNKINKRLKQQQFASRLTRNLYFIKKLP
ncbi:phospholipid carrier-dependent glycosyltransferase [Flavobacteriaceae bacterium R38]|nr:phospholipid carrier-dependent glycosyltransferase [Flavobacteriaceae bacterium R38]